jgi:nickel-type superoxide dismutase maturation protease
VGQLLKSVYPLRVNGESMQPRLRAGALVLARAIDPHTRLRVGDVVVAQRPDRPGLEIIKRIRAIDAQGKVFLVGDNPARSTESVDFGWVARDQILARVRWRYWPLPPLRL